MWALLEADFSYLQDFTIFEFLGVLGPNYFYEYFPSLVYCNSAQSNHMRLVECSLEVECYASAGLKENL